VKITYDPEADALFIQLRDAEPYDSTDIEEGVTVALDENGHIIALEILDAKKRLGPDAIGTLALEMMPFTLKESA